MRSIIPIVLVSTLLTLTQCVCQSRRAEEAPKPPPPAAVTPPAEEAPAPEAPASLDTKDLDGDETALLVAVLGEQFDPCGSPSSFLESLQAAKPCEMALTIGAFVVDKIQKGLSKRQIVGQLLKELARRSSKADFLLEDTPFIGEPDAEHQLVEFIDFQCPYCAAVSGPAKQLAKQYGVTLFVKHLPLTGHHPFAEAAAKASLAAHAQGKFWEVYAAFFANQATLSPETIEEHVKAAGVDMTRYAADVASQAVTDHITRDVADADRAQVDGTPTFFLNGMMLEFDQLEEALKEATGR
jgi:protein-disulfide isomerase